MFDVLVVPVPVLCGGPRRSLVETGGEDKGNPSLPTVVLFLVGTLDGNITADQGDGRDIVAVVNPFSVNYTPDWLCIGLEDPGRPSRAEGDPTPPFLYVFILGMGG